MEYMMMVMVMGWVVDIIHRDSKINAWKASDHIHFNRIRWHDSFQFWMLTFHNLNMSHQPRLYFNGINGSSNNKTKHQTQHNLPIIWSTITIYHRFVCVYELLFSPSSGWTGFYSIVKVFQATFYAYLIPFVPLKAQK